MNNKSTEERGYAANKYEDKKNKDYNEIIRTKSLDYTYKSITFGTFGAFGSGTWDVIERACDPRTHPDATGDYDPWRRPAPKRDFILSLGFALGSVRWPVHSTCRACHRHQRTPAPSP